MLQYGKVSSGNLYSEVGIQKKRLRFLLDYASKNL